MFASVFNTNGNGHSTYEPLSATHHDQENNAPKKTAQSFIQTSFSIALVIFGIVQIGLIFYALSLLRALSLQVPNDVSTVQHPLQAPQVSDCSCGATIEEARALGCIFDVLSLSWLPPPCIDAALTREFATAGPGPDGAWDYWAHRNGTAPLTLDEVGALAGSPDGVVYTSLGFHVLHCSFYWRKQWRAVRGVGALALEARYDRESHVEHCQKVFMMEGSRDKGMTEALVRLGGAFF